MEASTRSSDRGSMNKPSIPVSASYRQNLLALWGVFVAFAILLIYMSESMHAELRVHLNGWDLLTIGMSLYCLQGAYWFRRVWPKRPSRRAASPEQRSFLIQLISFAAAGGMVVWGVIGQLAFASPAWLSYTLYVAGIVLLLLFIPTRSSVTFGE